MLIRRLDATRNHVASNLDESIRGEEGKFVLRNPLNFVIVVGPREELKEIVVGGGMSCFGGETKKTRMRGRRRNMERVVVVVE